MSNLQSEEQQALEEVALPAVIVLVWFAIAGQLMFTGSKSTLDLLPSSQSLPRALRLSPGPLVELLEIRRTWQCQKGLKLRGCMRPGSVFAATVALGTSTHSLE